LVLPIGFVLLKLLALWCVIWVVDVCFSGWGSGESKILLMIAPWVWDVFHDFGMNFQPQDLIYFCKEFQILLMSQTCKDDTAQIEMNLNVMCHI
jgi:hypothetical protein